MLIINFFYIKAVIDSNAFEIIIKNLKNYTIKVKKEILWIISNVIDGGTDEQKEYVLQFSWDTLFNPILENNETTTNGIECLEKILIYENAKKDKKFLNNFVETGG